MTEEYSEFTMDQADARQFYRAGGILTLDSLTLWLQLDDVSKQLLVEAREATIAEHLAAASLALSSADGAATVLAVADGGEAARERVLSPSRASTSSCLDTSSSCSHSVSESRVRIPPAR